MPKKAKEVKICKAELQSIAGTKTKTNRRQLHKRTAGSTKIQQFRLNINHLFGVGGN